MPVAQSAASALEQDDFLSVFGDVADVFSGLGVVGHGAAGHFDDLVGTVLSEALVLRAVAAVFGEYVTVVLQVQQGPVVAVAPQDDMASSASVASVGTAIGDVLLAAQMYRAASAFAGAAVDFHVINKIRFSHSQ